MIWALDRLRERGHADVRIDLPAAALRARGTGRYSLMTGDLGAAIFASDCLDARTAVPIVDDV